LKRVWEGLLEDLNTLILIKELRMSTSLKKEFLELLKKDVEFRYAVAGYLGLLEILKRLDRLEEGQNRLWEEVRALREGQTKLWENQNRLWEEVRALREGQNRLWEEVKALREGQNRLWEEVKALREGQNKLWENQNRLWEEVKALREGQNRLWEEVRALREDHNRLWRSFRSFLRDFRELGRAVGMTLDHYTASLLAAYLEEKGYPAEKVDIQVNVKFMVDGRTIEVDIFNRDPLIIGEVTTYIRSSEEARKEIEKLTEKKQEIEKIHGRKAEITILAAANVEKEALKTLEEIAGEKGITLIVGREVKTPYP